MRVLKQTEQHVHSGVQLFVCSSPFNEIFTLFSFPVTFLIPSFEFPYGLARSSVHPMVSWGPRIFPQSDIVYNIQVFAFNTHLLVEAITLTTQFEVEANIYHSSRLAG